jgi:hypothetical protein
MGVTRSNPLGLNKIDIISQRCHEGNIAPFHFKVDPKARELERL